MTVSEIQEITMIDNDIQVIHQQLRELYERRAELMKLPATDRPRYQTPQTISSHILRSLDLSLDVSARGLSL